MKKKPTINTYSCEVCQERIVTEDIDEGTTPASLTCPVCNADMHSAKYNCDQKQEAFYFWFSPDSPLQLKRQVKWELQWMGAKGIMKLEMALVLQQKHVAKGGLLLAPSRQVIKRWELATPNKGITKEKP